MPPKKAQAASHASMARGRRLLERGIDKAMARADRRKDPGAEALPAQQGGGQPADPAGIDLQLLPGLAIGDGNRRGGLAKVQLDHGEAMERRIRNVDALPDEQLPNLGQPQPVAEPPLDGRALRLAGAPSRRRAGARPPDGAREACRAPRRR